MPFFAIAAAVTAAASIGSAVIGGNAAKDAASTQAGAANQAAQVQEHMFDVTQANLQPYNQFGQGALGGPNGLRALLGFDGGGGAGGASGPGDATGVQYGDPANADWQAYLSANPDVNQRALELVNSGVIGPTGQWKTPADWASFHYANTGKTEGRNLPMLAAGAGGGTGNPILDALRNTPGYQFTLNEGLNGILSKATATGGLGGGNTLKALMTYGQGLADTTYESRVADLLSAATLGENAAAGVGSAATAAGANIGNSLIGAGNARAAGQVGAANALTGGIDSLSSNYLLASLLRQPPPTGDVFTGADAGMTAPY